jgi:cyclophilin family peptidyl-prolyl cis-trans isomerase
MSRVLLVVAAVLVPALAGCGGSKPTASTTITTSAPPTTTSPPPTAQAGGCTSVNALSAKARHGTKPTKALDQSKTYTVTLKTNCGSFAIKLATKTSPATTASFVGLVRSGYFDGTVFHRIVPGFVIQGGDPTATGAGGPGYSTVDKPRATTRYTLGVVAMAKTAQEAAGTSGSQFFVVTAADAQLPPQYAVLGTVSAGLPVVKRIGKLGDASEQPTETVEIEQATVSVK